MNESSHLAEFSREGRIVLATASLEFDQQRASRIRSLAAAESNWAAVQNVARRHGTVALLHRALAQFASDLVPADVMQSAMEARQRQTARNLQLTAELVQLVTRLEDAGIEALSFKGPTLTQRIYGDLGLRHFMDLDLLIADGQLDRAIDVFREAGYTTPPWLTIEQQRYLARVIGQVPLLSPKRVYIELHTRLMHEHFHFPMEFQELWSRRDTVQLAGKLIPTFSQEDLLLYLSIHGAKHGWQMLKWICDCAELIRAIPEDRWTVVLERAERLRCEVMLLLAVLLASRELSVEPPVLLVESMRENERLKRLTGFVEQHLFRSPPAAAPIATVCYHYRCRENRRDAVRFLMSKLWMVALADFQQVCLPRWAWWMYPIVRLLRLLRIVQRKPSHPIEYVTPG